VQRQRVEAVPNPRHWNLLQAPVWVLTAAVSILTAEGACEGPEGHPPVARFAIQPEYVPAGQATEVVLDGRKSCDELDHPEGCSREAGEPVQTCPGGVRFQWTLDHEALLVEGSMTGPYLKISLTTTAPVTVTLEVTDCDGRTATARRTIGVVVPSDQIAPRGTPTQ